MTVAITVIAIRFNIAPLLELIIEGDNWTVQRKKYGNEMANLTPQTLSVNGFPVRPFGEQVSELVLKIMNLISLILDRLLQRRDVHDPCTYEYTKNKGKHNIRHSSISFHHQTYLSIITLKHAVLFQEMLMIIDLLLTRTDAV
jgi:hypothetical protein